MEAVQLESEELRIAESIGLPLEGLDLIVGPFQRDGGDRVVVPGQQPAPIPEQRPGELQ